MLEFLEKLAVQKRQLDRVLDRLERLVLSPDLLPGQFRHIVEVMLARLRMRKNFQRNPVIRIDPNFVAGFELALHQLGGALENQGLQSMFRADAEPVRAEDLGDLRDRTGGLESEVAHHHIGFVDQNARALLEVRQIDARIDVAIIIRAADDNVRRFPRGIVQVSADAIRGRSHFLDDFLELLNHLLRFTDDFLLRLDLRTDDVEFAAMAIFRRNRGDNQIERLQQRQLARSGLILRTGESLRVLALHAPRL